MKADRVVITRAGYKTQPWNSEYKMIEIKMSNLKWTKYQLKITDTNK